MMPQKGLSHYQAVQKSVVADELRMSLEKVIEKARLYGIDFLQNKALVESILALPEEVIDETMVKKTQKLLSWLWQTQEEAKLSS